MDRRLQTAVREWPLREPFVISRGMIASARMLEEILHGGAHVGRGEVEGVSYAGETPETMAAQLAGIAADIRAGADRMALLSLLPPGGTRFALDSALWDLEAKQTGRSPFAMAGVVPAPVQSSRTIGIRSLEGYAEAAAAWRDVPVLKVKVGAEDPLAAIAAVHRAAPDAQLIVDPNQAWSVAQLKAIAPDLPALGVVLLEQPIPVGAEPDLDGWAPPVPLCADELIETEDDLRKATGRFACVNIKLDKTGGLTAALALADRAEAIGFGLMVGCMMGSSLAMAPAMVLAQRCRFVDLDAPTYQDADRREGFTYRAGRVDQPWRPALWG